MTEVTRKGIGGFLNPPTHPEHNYSVETNTEFHSNCRGCLSLTTALEASWIEDEVRAEVKRLLDSWQRPALESPEIQDWIHQVLGYFRGCYRNPALPESQQWNASYLIINQGANPLAFVMDHAGVRWIRKFYPEFVPTAEHFEHAYWGKRTTKPNKV